MPSLPLYQVLLLLVGVAQAIQALTVWAVLARRHARLPVALWSGGALAIALAALLLAGRGLLPDWMAYELMAVVFNSSFALRILALRMDLGWPLYLGRATLATVGVTLAYLLCRWLLGAAPASLVGAFIVGTGNLWLAWHAAAVGRQLRSPSAWLMAASMAVFSLILLARLVAVVAGWLEPLVLQSHWSAGLLLAVGVASSVLTNLGYLGMALDRVSAAASKAQQAELAALKQRDSAEDDARALRQLLDERDRLSAQRDQLLQVLAHEINQPLHNAGGVLQALDDALLRPDAGGLAARRLQQALEVLAGVRSVLDNTLAAASLLTRNAPIQCHEVDLDFLVELTLGDLPVAQRALVSVTRHTTLQEVEVEPGLMRLALRNLLSNALRHGRPGTVRVEIDETQAPPALLLSVVDDGPGAPQLVRVDSAAPSPAADQPLPNTQSQSQSQGLGLVLARRVADLHGGSLVLRQNQPRGLVASLVLPLHHAG